MKALSIRHPSIDLLLAGLRSIEVRAPPTHHRGPLLLHAATAFGPAEREELTRLRAAHHDLAEPGPEQRGALVGIAELVECRPLQDADWEAALARRRPGSWWAWRLASIERFPVPIRYRGRLFMWDVADAEFERALAAAGAGGAAPLQIRDAHRKTG